MIANDTVLPSAEMLFERAACGLLVTSRDGTILRVNQTFCKWMGYTPHELVGQKRIQDLLTMGGRIFHQTHWAPLLQMQGSVAEVKLDLIQKSGPTVPVILNAVRHEYSSGIYHELAVFIAEDRHKYEREHVQARKRAEELLTQQLEAQQALTLAKARLRIALESAQLFVWDVDPLTYERRYEDEVAMLLGLPAPQTITAEQYEACIEPEDRAQEQAAFSRALISAHESYRCVYRLNGMDGVQRTVSSSGHSVFDQNGKLSQFVGVLQDISELTRQRAEAEDRALFAEQMIGIVSHDLRNPLSAIRMGAHLLERSQLTPKQVRILEHINQSTDRAQRLITDLLDFTVARVGQGITVSRQPIELHNLVSASVAELRLAFPDHRLEHHYSGQGDCIADGDRLVQLIGNLVANAVAYGVVDQAILVSSHIEHGAFVISVHNHGKPIEATVLPHLFEPMSRGDSGENKARSVGLGLFIVREIVRAHGGSIAVTSTEEAGTLFTATFPRGLEATNFQES
ncbi:sigma-B regulation protein RsbU (phosphoserine phosphatase) [Pseudomonas duriflava]|uniref:histidine kinase n=1 Tax=Pseudomonas duriflava TaxID=459528 RepID=A0A562QLD6_9PSED|nr:HAMP domain-containing sensor histidine kinase [Pseudomonas duriflava]TWI57561.1 sigma-B regulation protein RsbU (phosphoserine phosphatase) [Pseudomonas duriflava]